jgi:hypothetical protein
MNVEELKTKCDLMLEAMVGEHLIKKWWKSPNRAFDMRTPKEQLKENPGSVYSYLLSHMQR